MGIPLQDSTFRELRDFIYEKSGIFISDSKKYFIESRLTKKVQERNLKGFEDYINLVKYRSSNGDEVTKLIDAVVTKETYFFREPHHYDALCDFVIPEITKQRGSGRIRIWSAACSTGEEPYTISIIFMAKRPDIKLELYATDISQSALNSAEKAVYNSYSTRNVPEPYLKKYFKQEEDNYVLDQSVKKSVRFMNINLTDEKKMKTMREIDVIFCRNVLIYFDDNAKKKAVSLLYDSLKPGGFLIIGSSESLHSVTRAFRPLTTKNTVLYRKG
ncbi:MAG: protein-glutamate O-methyltransferase CheR [Nitrospirae bacterium]|nr:protein-glutamate O-methyltransferase CheR [Nitrospirota bacterium]